MSFIHFLLTRFNLVTGYPGWEADRHGHPTLTGEWMEERIAIFTRYCLPSVLNQSNRQFQWVLLFDEHTSQKYVDAIKYHTDRQSNIKIIFLSRNAILKEIHHRIFYNFYNSPHPKQIYHQTNQSFCRWYYFYKCKNFFPYIVMRTLY